MNTSITHPAMKSSQLLNKFTSDAKFYNEILISNSLRVLDIIFVGWKLVPLRINTWRRVSSKNHCD